MKKTALILAISGVMFGIQAQAAPEKYQIDPGHFFVQFKVPHLGYSYILGTFNDVQGSYTYDDQTGEISDVDVVIDTNSIDTNHGERDNHLRGEKYLNTSAYNQATFKSTGWEDGKLTGDLTVYGTTHQITIPVTKIGEGDDPWGKYRSGFQTNFDLKFDDYGIPSKIAQVAEIYVTGEGIKQ